MIPIPDLQGMEVLGRQNRKEDLLGLLENLETVIVMVKTTGQETARKHLIVDPVDNLLENHSLHRMNRDCGWIRRSRSEVRLVSLSP